MLPCNWLPTPSAPSDSSVIRLVVRYSGKKFLVVVPTDATFKDVKHEIVRVYCGINHSSISNSVSELCDGSGCVLFDDYKVKVLLSDMARVYAFEHGEENFLARATTPQLYSTPVPSHPPFFNATSVIATTPLSSIGTGHSSTATVQSSQPLPVTTTLEGQRSSVATILPSSSGAFTAVPRNAESLTPCAPPIHFASLHSGYVGRHLYQDYSRVSDGLLGSHDCTLDNDPLGDNLNESGTHLTATNTAAVDYGNGLNFGASEQSSAREETLDHSRFVLHQVASSDQESTYTNSSKLSISKRKQQKGKNLKSLSQTSSKPSTPLKKSRKRSRSTRSGTTNRSLCLPGFSSDWSSAEEDKEPSRKKSKTFSVNSPAGASQDDGKMRRTKSNNKGRRPENSKTSTPLIDSPAVKNKHSSVHSEGRESIISSGSAEKSHANPSNGDSGFLSSVRDESEYGDKCVSVQRHLTTPGGDFSIDELVNTKMSHLGSPRDNTTRENTFLSQDRAIHLDSNDVQHTKPASTSADHTKPASTSADRTKPASTSADRTKPASTSADRTKPASTSADRTKPASTSADRTKPASTSADRTKPASTSADRTKPASTSADHTKPASTSADLVTTKSADQPTDASVVLAFDSVPQQHLADSEDTANCNDEDPDVSRIEETQDLNFVCEESRPCSSSPVIPLQGPVSPYAISDCSPPAPPVSTSIAVEKSREGDNLEGSLDYVGPSSNSNLSESVSMALPLLSFKSSAYDYTSDMSINTDSGGRKKSTRRLKLLQRAKQSMKYQYQSADDVAVSKTSGEGPSKEGKSPNRQRQYQLSHLKTPTSLSPVRRQRKRFRPVIPLRNNSRKSKANCLTDDVIPNESVEILDGPQLSEEVNDSKAQQSDSSVSSHDLNAKVQSAAKQAATLCKTEPNIPAGLPASEKSSIIDSQTPTSSSPAATPNKGKIQYSNSTIVAPASTSETVASQNTTRCHSVNVPSSDSDSESDDAQNITMKKPLNVQQSKTDNSSSWSSGSESALSDKAETETKPLPKPPVSTSSSDSSEKIANSKSASPDVKTTEESPKKQSIIPLKKSTISSDSSSDWDTSDTEVDGIKSPVKVSASQKKANASDSSSDSSSDEEMTQVQSQSILKSSTENRSEQRTSSLPVKPPAKVTGTMSVRTKTQVSRFLFTSRSKAVDNRVPLSLSKMASEKTVTENTESSSGSSSDASDSDTDSDGMEVSTNRKMSSLASLVKDGRDRLSLNNIPERKLLEKLFPPIKTKSFSSLTPFNTKPSHVQTDQSEQRLHKRPVMSALAREEHAEIPLSQQEAALAKTGSKNLSVLLDNEQLWS